MQFSSAKWTSRPRPMASYSFVGFAIVARADYGRGRNEVACVCQTYWTCIDSLPCNAFDVFFNSFSVLLHIPLRRFDRRCLFSFILLYCFTWSVVPVVEVVSLLLFVGFFIGFPSEMNLYAVNFRFIEALVRCVQRPICCACALGRFARAKCTARDETNRIDAEICVLYECTIQQKHFYLHADCS